MNRLISTYKAAARVVGVSPPTIKAWVSKGWLTAPPWSRESLFNASEQGRQRQGRGSTAPHGTPARWRHGCQCSLCKAANAQDTKTYHREQRHKWWANRKGPLVQAILDGASYRQALTEIGVTAQAVSAYRKLNPAFAEDLDNALILTRDPALAHGTHYAWRQGCRCPECRTHHNTNANTDKTRRRPKTSKPSTSTRPRIDVPAAIEQWHNGATLTQIARTQGISPATVSKHLRAAGLDTASRRALQPKAGGAVAKLGQ